MAQVSELQPQRVDRVADDQLAVEARAVALDPQVVPPAGVLAAGEIAGGLVAPEASADLLEGDGAQRGGAGKNVGGEGIMIAAGLRSPVAGDADADHPAHVGVPPLRPVLDPDRLDRSAAGIGGGKPLAAARDPILGGDAVVVEEGDQRGAGLAGAEVADLGPASLPLPVDEAQRRVRPGLEVVARAVGGAGIDEKDFVVGAELRKKRFESAQQAAEAIAGQDDDGKRGHESEPRRQSAWPPRERADAIIAQGKSFAMNQLHANVCPAGSCTPSCVVRRARARNRNRNRK